MIELTKENFNEIVRGSKNLVIVDFWAVWCGPCRMVTPILDEIAEDYGEIITVGKLNVDEHMEIAKEFSIRNIPTVLFFKDGEIIDKQVGAMPKTAYMEKIDKFL